MIKEILFQYDLDNPVLELKFQSELSKIVKHYDSFTIAEEAEAVKILLGEIIPNYDKQRYYLDLAKSRGRIGSIAGQQCLYQLSILCN